MDSCQTGSLSPQSGRGRLKHTGIRIRAGGAGFYKSAGGSYYHLQRIEPS